MAPILSAHCLECHTTAGVSPRAKLDTYAGAAAVADLIASVSADREMPPWAFTHEQGCSDWKHARWMSEEEIATLQSWADADAPEGDPSAHKDAEPAPRPRLRHHSGTLDVGAEYQPTLGAGTLRCFVLDPSQLGEGLLTGMAFRPSTPWAVHQVTLYALTSAEAVAQAEAQDAQDATAGYSCFADAGVPGAELLLGASMSSGPTRLPEGTGLPFDRGLKWVAQIHYNLILGTDLKERTRIDIELDPAVRPARWLEVRVPTFQLAADRDRVEVQHFVPVTSNVQVLGIYPRMRVYGQDLWLAREGASAECVAQTVRWDFHLLQQFYELQTPVALTPQDALRITCGYTTLGRSAPLVSGPRPEDEECAAYLYVE